MKMKILAVANPKGGIGKTAFSVNTVHAAVEHDSPTLRIDFDKQGSFSLAHPHGPDYNPTKRYLMASDLFYAPEKSADAELEYLAPGQAIIRADYDELLKLEKAPDDFAKHPARYLRQFSDRFEVAVIDTPGTINMLLKAALTCADAVVSPLTLGLYDTAGLAQLWQIIRDVKSGGFNPKLRMIGMLPSKVDTRDKMAMAELDALRKHPKFGPAILPFMLAQKVPVARAINLRKPVWKGAKSKSHREAGEQWKQACDHVLTSLGSK